MIDMSKKYSKLLITKSYPQSKMPTIFYYFCISIKIWD